jgi:alanyl-tRNA synthetase
MSGVNEIRSAFLDYFAKNGHQVEASSPLVPRNDPTLMFTNAGMVQFKNVFTGVEKRPYSRAATSQKCVRAGGKHNDLDNVGYTARHHTFFEMLGNFSFGDYFKEEAISLAWNLITREFGLTKDRLLVTVYHTDDEAADLWKKIAGFTDDKIIRIPTSDNFWQMGDTGPCGPCSEIFIDQGDKLWGGPPGSADEDGDRFLEFWNLVFMQFEQIEPGNRIPLPKPSIDTGMGLERIAAVLQGVHSNYDTDLFRTLIEAVAHATGVAPEGEPQGLAPGDRRPPAHLVLPGRRRRAALQRGSRLRAPPHHAPRHAPCAAPRRPRSDHVPPRAGARPRDGAGLSRTGARRAAHHRNPEAEETRFRKTLERGLSILDEETRNLTQGQKLSGETAFTLYDTFGFPLDLTQDALKPRGIGVDTDAFNAAMQRQREMARAAWAGSGEAATEAVWFGIKERAGATEFLGLRHRDRRRRGGRPRARGRRGRALAAGETGLVVVNQTPFYAESGGQVGDTGTIAGEGVRLRVTATEKKLGDLWVHHVTVEEGTLKVGQAVELGVDHERRSAVRANHSATHLLHEALRQVLGDHVAQKGSLVAPDRLRFDFSHPKPIDEAELQRVEDIANQVLLQNEPVVTKLMAVDEAIESGARALFGEKYGDEVRVVSMGKGGGTKAFSVELCGGTHVGRTGDIGLVAVVGEGAVAAGVRRLEAMTGDAARRHLAEESRRLHAIAGLLKTPGRSGSRTPAGSHRGAAPPGTRSG